MNEDKYIELINKEIDGISSPKDSAKLKEYLAMNPEAQNLYNDLIKLSNTLQQVKAVDPSPNLKKHILNSIHWDKYTTKEKRNFFKSFIPFLKLRFNFSFVYAFSAGLIAGIIIYSLLTDKIDRTTSMDSSHLTGTLLINDPSLNFDTVEQLEIDLNEIVGELNVKKANDIVLVELHLKTQQQVEMVLEFDEQDIGFNSLRHLKEGGTNINITDNYLKLNHMGDGRYILVFKDKTPVVTPMNLKIFSEGVVLYEKALLTTSDANNEN